MRVVQGGDWGAGTTTALAQIMPPGLVGIHLSWQFVFPEQIPEQLSFEEKRAVEGAKFFPGEGNGYFRQQSTRPQTVGYRLADSPAGQALWIYEKFQAWTDNKGLPEDALSMDQTLDNISADRYAGTRFVDRRFTDRRERIGVWNRGNRAISEDIMPNGIIRVLVADDHAVVRNGIAGIVNAQSDMKVVAEAPDGRTAVKQFTEEEPDICLIDLQMPQLDGIGSWNRSSPEKVMHA